MRVPVEVKVGGVRWLATAGVELVACPHVGDKIIVGAVEVSCQFVLISSHHAEVRELKSFSSEADMLEYERLMRIQ